MSADKEAPQPSQPEASKEEAKTPFQAWGRQNGLNVTVSFTGQPEASTLDEQTIFNFLQRKYVQRADDRQKTMGLVYMEVETHDLARELEKMFSQASTAPEVTDERQAFEQAMREISNGEPDWQSPAAMWAWRAWQARAALAARPASEGKDTERKG